MRLSRLLLLGLLTVSTAKGQADFPLVPDDINVMLFAREPLVRNPCAITFDVKGRLCIGMGPQYRKPKPDTPGDSVWILLDEDEDGTAEGIRNGIQRYPRISLERRSALGCQRP